MNRANDIVHAMCEGIRRDRSEKILKEFGIETDDDLVKRLAFEYYGIKTRNESLNKRFDQIMEENRHYRTLAHTYKIELGRCVRKLTRLYKFFKRLKRFGENELETAKQQTDTINALSIINYALQCIVDRLDTDELKHWI